MSVTIFEDTNFGGRSEDFDVGEHQLVAAADLNDEVSSIKVPPGMVAILYEYSYLNKDQVVGGCGRSVDLIEDFADLATLGLGDTVSFVDVFAAESDVVSHNHATGQDQTAHLTWVRGSLVDGQYVAGHWERPRAHPVTAGPPVVSPAPPLQHLLRISRVTGEDWTNPAFDTSPPNWSSDVAGGATFDGSDSHPFEWVSVLNPAVEQDDEVGIAGYAVGVDQSKEDLPFTHPFGNDFEFGIVPDGNYAALLAPSNHNPDSDNDNIKDAFLYSAQIGVPAIGAIPMEVEAGMVPEAYQAQVGNRVAAYGRWIVDAGHGDYHTEIHPPLLLARARPVDAQEVDAQPDETATTLMHLWSRPYQAAQKFTDGDQKQLSLRPYVKNIAFTLSDIEAYPPIFPKPFDGIHLVSFLVRPPMLTPPAQHLELIAPHLECSYSFMTNKSCGVQIQQSLSDPNAVEIILALNSAGYPTIPEPSWGMEKFKIDDLVKNIPGDLDSLTTFLVDVVETYQSRLGTTDAELSVRTYNPLVGPDLTANIVPFTPVAGLPRSAVGVDDTQPFPIIGWMKVKWAYSSPKETAVDQGHGAVLSASFNPSGQADPGQTGSVLHAAQLRVPLRRPRRTE